MNTPICSALSRDGCTLYEGYLDGVIKVSDVDTGCTQNTLKTYPFKNFTVSPDGEEIHLTLVNNSGYTVSTRSGRGLTDNPTTKKRCNNSSFSENCL